jgi:hypothetical protein
MYHYQCDWCGKQINTERKQYVKASISIVTLEKDRIREERVAQAEPTRFFHVTPLRSKDEWDRLGLDIEVGSDDLGDCCYTRALRAIEGHDFDEPDAGLEWRLMPIDGADEPVTQERSGSRRPPAQPVDADADLEAFYFTLAPSQRHKLWGQFEAQGISDLDQLSAMSDDELIALDGVAWLTRCKIREFIAARDEARKKPAKAGV